MGLDIEQLRLEIIRPALTFIGLQGQAAENLVLGTAITESRLKYLKQLGSGPAKSLWQIEPATHDDIWANYLEHRPQLAEQLMTLRGRHAADGMDPLVGNLYYGAAMCRVFYRRVPAPLPRPEDAHGMAAYWKSFYNTRLGKGTVEKAIPHFKEAIE